MSGRSAYASLKTYRNRDCNPDLAPASRIHRLTAMLLDAAYWGLCCQTLIGLNSSVQTGNGLPLWPIPLLFLSGQMFVIAKHGQSVGQEIVGIRPVHRHTGQRLTTAAYTLKRVTLPWLLYGLPFALWHVCQQLGFFAFIDIFAGMTANCILMATENKGYRTLGDLASNAVVVPC